MWDLPGSGIKSVSPVLAGGFFTAEPPEKPLIDSFERYGSSFVKKKKNCKVNLLILRTCFNIGFYFPLCKLKTHFLRVTVKEIAVCCYWLYYCCSKAVWTNAVATGCFQLFQSVRAQWHWKLGSSAALAALRIPRECRYRSSTIREAPFDSVTLESRTKQWFCQLPWSVNWLLR